MTPVRIATARNADTSPMVQPSLSIKNLQIIISTVPVLLLPRCKHGAVGYHFYITCRLPSRLLHPFTLVKMHRGKIVCDLINVFLSFIFSTRLAAWPVFDPVNTSGKYPGNDWPAPAGNAGPAFYRRSAPGTASKGKYPAWMPIGHWLFFPAALSCKAQPVVSYLLY